MLVVSDATPLNVLIRVGQHQILHLLFGRVVVPPAVIAELSNPRTPEPVRLWVEARPAWIQEVTPKTEGPTEARLGAGEREAIALALELRADYLLVDDWAARQRARGIGIPITGTLGVLKMASEEGLLDIRAVVEDLARIHFRMDPDTLADILGERG